MRLWRLMVAGIALLTCGVLVSLSLADDPPSTAPAPAPAPSTASATPTTLPTQPAAIAPDPDPAPPIRWENICHISVTNSRLIVHTDLTPDDLDSLGPDRQNLEIEGIPGTCSLSLGRQRFLLRNTRIAADRRSTVMVYVTTMQTSIELTLSGGKSGGVTLYQAGWGNRRRDYTPGWIRLTAYGDDVAEGHVTLTAPNFETFLITQPHAVNRYIRPMLRQLQKDEALLGPAPAEARQVLQIRPPTEAIAPTTTPTTRDALAPTPKPNPELLAEMKRWIARLDDERFTNRDQAVAKLQAMGPAVLEVLSDLDRDRLSPQQNLGIDRLLAGMRARFAPLTISDAKRLRNDRHFLFNSLYCDDPEIRRAAADLLSRITRRPFPKDSPVLDVSADWNRRAEAIEKLRDEWVEKLNPD